MTTGVVRSLVFAEEVRGNPGAYLVTLDCGHKLATRQQLVTYKCFECSLPAPLERVHAAEKCWGDDAKIARLTELDMGHEPTAVRLRHIAVEEARAGAAMFMGKPDRWYEDPHWRCENGHVSTMYLKSEAIGCAVCLACFKPVWLTFPEDIEGPLPP